MLSILIMMMVMKTYTPVRCKKKMH